MHNAYAIHARGIAPVAAQRGAHRPIIACPDARERAGPVFGDEETQAQRARARRDNLFAALQFL